jgi:hypothetical protein
VDDEADPAGVIRHYIDTLPSGSYVALTHWWDPADGSEGSTLAREFERHWRTSTMGTGRYRTREEILSYSTAWSCWTQARSNSTIGGRPGPRSANARSSST